MALRFNVTLSRRSRKKGFKKRFRYVPHTAENDEKVIFKKR